jgi:hypothetical protein
MRIPKFIKWLIGIPTEESVFPDAGRHDGKAYIKGAPGPSLKDLKTGEYFAIVGKENYPKVKLEQGYYDLSFQVRHISPNPNWKTVRYTEDQVREVFRAKGISDDKIEVLLKTRRIIVHDGEI